MPGLDIADALFIVFLIAWCVHGCGRGFLLMSARLFIFLASVFVAVLSYPGASSSISAKSNFPADYANLLSFLAIFGLTYVALGLSFTRFVRTGFIRILGGLHLGRVDRLAGVLPAIVAGVVWASLILSVLSFFPGGNFIKDRVARSKTGAPIVHIASVIEPQVKKIAGGVIEDTVTFLTRRERNHTWKPNIPKGTRIRIDAAGEIYMLGRINEERGLRGLRLLKPDTRLRDIARSHSMDMAVNNYFDHKSPTTGYLDDRLLDAGMAYFIAGENLAYAKSVELAHIALMESEGHRENVLRPNYGKAGIGIMRVDGFGYMCTQVFMD